LGYLTVLQKRSKHLPRSLSTAASVLDHLFLTFLPAYLISCFGFAMAVSIGYEGLEAHVLIDARAATEHIDNEAAPPKTTTLYIEARAGEPFTVRYFIPSEAFNAPHRPSYR
jgi:hypothetical protein